MLYECLEVCTGGLILVEASSREEAREKVRRAAWCPIVDCKPFGGHW